MKVFIIREKMQLGELAHKIHGIKPSNTRQRRFRRNKQTLEVEWPPQSSHVQILVYLAICAELCGNWIPVHLFLDIECYTQDFYERWRNGSLCPTVCLQRLLAAPMISHCPARSVRIAVLEETPVSRNRLTRGTLWTATIKPFLSQTGSL